ncbi:hypothetical protein HRbin40_00831 [bacterium HR40]|nr:hypothetical protein HRbin40_00831 [bacterium HR40]
MTAGASTAEHAFEAVLYPNPALSDRAFWLFMALTGAVTVAMASLFVSLGAWPVGGFFGLDLLLLWLAFRAARRNARWQEWVRVDAGAVTVRRVAPDGRTAEWQFEPSWVQIHFDEPPQPHSLVVLSSHGRRIALGSFLTPEERREFAQALSDALRRFRRPLF